MLEEYRNQKVGLFLTLSLYSNFLKSNHPLNFMIFYDIDLNYYYYYYLYWYYYSLYLYFTYTVLIELFIYLFIFLMFYEFL
jgi:hypothetical protein